MSVDEKSKVYLIGAGPGNPNLLTKKAERCIKKAEVILYDRLVNPLILQYAPADAEFIDVGKKPYAKHIQQDEINLKSLKRLKSTKQSFVSKVAIQQYLVVLLKKSIL